MTWTLVLSLSLTVNLYKSLNKILKHSNTGNHSYKYIKEFHSESYWFIHISKLLIV